MKKNYLVLFALLSSYLNASESKKVSYSRQKYSIGTPQNQLIGQYDTRSNIYQIFDEEKSLIDRDRKVSSALFLVSIVGNSSVVCCNGLTAPVVFCPGIMLTCAACVMSDSLFQEEQRSLAQKREELERRMV